MKSLLLALPAAVLLALSIQSAQAGKTEFVFLITGDGIRHQEVFTGADAALVSDAEKKSSGAEDPKRLREEFWDENPIKRREKLMPFFWKELSKKGIILGNRDAGSPVNLRNPHHFSYPGYAEIINGQAVPEVTSNSAVWSPRETVLEFIRRELQLPAEKVALFGSWNIFKWIGMQQEGAVFCNAGYDRIPDPLLNEKMRFWNDLQFEALSPWNTVRHDAVTLGLTLEYIQVQKPKFLYLALGETDDWAHGRRYDRTIQTLRYFDDALKRLWSLLQENETYRDKSTLIITTDHGRGRTQQDWTSHGKDVPGANEVWIGIFGPDTPGKGEIQNPLDYSASNIAATILKFYNLDPKRFNANAASPIAEAFAK
jgi:hypothetical protein